MIDRACDAILAFVAGYFATVLILAIQEILTAPAGPDPLDPIVARERWDVWAAAEAATRHPVIDGQLVDEPDRAAG